MNEKLTKAIELINNDNTVFAAVSDSDIITSPLKGISFVASLCNENKDLSSYCVADKIVGKAAAMLFVLLNIKVLHAKTLSKAGKKVLEDNGTDFSYDVLTDLIINRTGDGMCPMENAVKDDISPAQALEHINETIAFLKSVHNVKQH